VSPNWSLFSGFPQQNPLNASPLIAKILRLKNSYNC
jgi:hypothetical protein